MNIDNIENDLDTLSNPYQLIIGFIVDAIKTYPLFGLDDTESYFTEIKRLLNGKEISIQNIENYLNSIKHENSNETIWRIDSLHSFLEALEIMQLHNISFTDIKYLIDNGWGSV